MKVDRDTLAELGGDEMLLLDPDHYDVCVVGIAERCGMEAVAVYDKDCLLRMLVEKEGMTEEEAVEWYEYNMVGAYVGERTPMFMTRLDQGTTQ